jgi:phenylacetate-CoA ligase
VVRPKGLFLIGEPLDEPSRNYIDQTLGSRTFASYGANEFGLLALECKERSGMHVLSDSVIIEVIKDGRPALPGETGELVITGLLNTATPLIRYNIGDIGIMSGGSCPCGVTMPVLASVEGRAIDHVRLPDGGVVSPKRIMTIMHSIDRLPRSQLIQEELNVFALRVFADNAEGRAAAAEFLRQLRMEIGQNAVINVSYETPERLRAKFRPVISRLSTVKDDRWVKPISVGWHATMSLKFYQYSFD